MNRKTYLIALPLLLLAIGAIIGCIRGATADSPTLVDEQADDGGSHVDVDPRVEEALEVDESIEVLISLRDLDEIDTVPMSEWDEEMFLAIDWDLRAKHAQEVQAVVRAALGPEDATNVIGFKTSPALGATITASGLKILRNHPDVTGIGRAVGEPTNDLTLDSDGEWRVAP